MWALNLMQYHEQAQYDDGRASELSGIEADDAYAPTEHLKAVGSRIVLIAPVVHQLVGDDTTWDRVAIAQYRDRMAMVEMNQNADFQKSHEHKEAGMKFTIVMASFPIDDEPVPPQESAADADRLLLLQVVADSSQPDLAADIESTRIGRFWIEDRMIGDDRTFGEARYDLISADTAAELGARDYVVDDANYAVVIDPSIDEVARSLTDPSQVLF